ncbi:Transcriptional regulator AglR, LacI family [Rubrivivax sp. A210]|uniref:substrate-binding domain-containing protein n=1 Tax=Rubrivivax sp. A210 TaxID=2772301 RepID=UPI0019A46513|nr:substrate-binding domain-containing protein [Rubrivivax sp. A210]CAD5366272.1 Transcriptional regulator AglR, LacI family [Rubrivivax sp. A210]
MSINLKELSARLGLSPTTVSRALSGYRDVSPTTRERVELLARELGYQPNRAARQVAMGRADAVGIVYSPANEFLGNPSFLEMLEGLAHSLEEFSCDLLLAAAPRQNELHVYERMVRGRRVDGLIVAHTLRDDPRIAYLRKSSMPFVAYGRTAQPADFPWLDFDNETCSALGVRRLVELGHRRIAYVHAPLEYNFAHQRHAGFLAAMAEAGLAVPPGMVVGGSLDRRAGHAAGRQLLALSPRPTAVLVDNNLSGVGLIRALLDAKLEIGRDISIIVNEGLPADTLFSDLVVAAVKQPTAYRSGQTMGAMIRALIERRPLEQAQKLFQPVYSDGNSVGPPRA